MNEFTASNGICIRIDSSIVYSPKVPASFGPIGSYVNGSSLDVAMAEFYRARDDERLGRWRWPENPDYVVYPREGYPPQNARRVRVILEPTGDFVDTVEGSKIDGPFKDAARAYFDAHPEPKPWHAAAEGEVWILMFHNSSHAWFVNGDYFQSTKTLTNIAKTDEGIIAGRCIFPEEVSS